MDMLIMAVMVAAIGGALSAYLGFLGGSEPFNPRKFTYGIIRGAIGGVALVVAVQTPTDIQGLIMLFLSAAGIDTLSYNVYKSVHPTAPA